MKNTVEGTIHLSAPQTVLTMLANISFARNGQSDLVGQNSPPAANACTHFLCIRVRKSARAASVHTDARAYMLQRKGFVTKSCSFIFRDWNMDNRGI